MVAPGRQRGVAPLLVGAGAGMCVEVLAIPLAIISGAAGHGDYGAARALIPLPMLLAGLVEGTIGPWSIAAGLLQFPLYGALIGWALSRRAYGAIAALPLVHLAVAIACFSGALPTFS